MEYFRDQQSYFSAEGPYYASVSGSVPSTVSMNYPNTSESENYESPYPFIGDAANVGYNDATDTVTFNGSTSFGGVQTGEAADRPEPTGCSASFGSAATQTVIPPYYSLNAPYYHHDQNVSGALHAPLPGPAMYQAIGGSVLSTDYQWHGRDSQYVLGGPHDASIDPVLCQNTAISALEILRATNDKEGEQTSGPSHNTLPSMTMYPTTGVPADMSYLDTVSFSNETRAGQQEQVEGYANPKLLESPGESCQKP